LLFELADVAGPVDLLDCDIAPIEISRDAIVTGINIGFSIVISLRRKAVNGQYLPCIQATLEP
jgi:hypothetical protein